MEALEKVERLKAELNALRPISAEMEARIMQKFRLDWNYHSNKLEGNSLTFGETKALILFGLTANGKPLKDHFEITGHDEAIKWIEEIVKGETTLTETFIRQLHTLLLKESYKVDALTPDGKPTRRRIEVGRYKTMPNHVLTRTGEMFYFAAPEETAAKMQDLIEWFREKKELAETNGVLLAAEFHYKFIRIHPFDDGNGRVARLLMNFILMQNGYPPVIIKTDDKENYFNALQQADAGIFEPFLNYIANNLVRSLEIMIRGAKGENIEEPDDLDKEIALLERKVRETGRKIEIQRSNQVLFEIFEKSISPLALKFFNEFKVFDKFYVQNRSRAYVNGAAVLGEQDNAIYYVKKEFQQTHEDVQEIRFHYSHIEFNQDGFGNFSYESHLTFVFELTRYKIINSETSAHYVKLYSEQITTDEIKEIIAMKKRKHLESIKEKINQIEQNGLTSRT